MTVREVSAQGVGDGRPLKLQPESIGWDEPFASAGEGSPSPLWDKLPPFLQSRISVSLSGCWMWMREAGRTGTQFVDSSLAEGVGGPGLSNMYRSGWLALEPLAMGRGVDPARNHLGIDSCAYRFTITKTDCPLSPDSTRACLRPVQIRRVMSRRVSFSDSQTNHPRIRLRSRS
jgi:hypothetical protein